MKRKILFTITILALLAAAFMAVFFPKLASPAVPYSSDLKLADRAYLDVVSIDTEYTISMLVDGINSNSKHELLCSCVTTEGETVWLHINTGHYMEYIDPDAEDYLNDPEKEYIPMKEFEKPVRINGIMIFADAVCEDLSEDLGQKYVLSFTHIG